jgi:hypothetical protein
MPFTVIWAESVIEQLAGLWLDTGDKGRFSGAIAEIDRVLSTSPHAAGRLLHEGIMVCSRDGVSVLFEIRDNEREAEGLVDLAEFLTLLRMRAERLAK